MPDPLVAFIKARIAEEERDAAYARGMDRGVTADDARPHWIASRGEVSWASPRGELVPVASASRELAAQHITRQDPAATLARCEALTALVDSMYRMVNDGDCNVDYVGERALKGIAAIWRWHEDWQEGWEP